MCVVNYNVPQRISFVILFNERLLHNYLWNKQTKMRKVMAKLMSLIQNIFSKIKFHPVLSHCDHDISLQKTWTHYTIQNIQENQTPFHGVKCLARTLETGTEFVSPDELEPMGVRLENTGS